jgi:hypothetical protein
MPYDESLATRVRELLANAPVAEKRMFGGVGFLLAGNMAVGVNGPDLIVRVSTDAFDELITAPGVRIFDLSGRPMKGWLLVGPAGTQTAAGLQEWLDRGLQFAAGLPPK